MPGLINDASSASRLTINPLHPTFGAEVTGVDFQTLSDEGFQDILALMAKYGFLVFRSTSLDDGAHVAFSRRFGDLDDIRPYMTGGRKPRCDYYELFDASNVDTEGNVLSLDSPRHHYGRGNGFFHIDSSFNPRRASYSLLRAAVLPPPNTGGNTEFADSRSAFETLPEAMKERLVRENYVGVHSLHHSRKRGSPEYFKDLNPEEFNMHRHRIAQVHEPSGRMNLYVGSHMRRIEGLEENESWTLMWALMGWATRPENTVAVEWKGVGDLIIWDNTAVMHRAAGGSFDGKYARDLRRTTVHDASSNAWGLNEKVDTRPGFNSNGKETISLGE